MAENSVAVIRMLCARQYLFAGLTDEQLAQVASRFTMVDCERDQTVFEQGQAGDSFYIVMSGRLRVLRNVRSTERFLSFLTPGDYFGEEALLFDRPRATMHPRHADLTLSAPGAGGI